MCTHGVLKGKGGRGVFNKGLMTNLVAIAVRSSAASASSTTDSRM